MLTEDPAPAPASTPEETARARAFSSGPPEWRGVPLQRGITICGLALFHELRESIGAPPLAETLTTGRFLADALRILWICAEEETVLDRCAANLPAAAARCRAWAEDHVSIAEAPEAIAIALTVWNNAHENRPQIVPTDSASGE